MSNSSNAYPPSLAIELIGSSSREQTAAPTVARKSASDGLTRLTVTLPKILDGQQASVASALLFDQLEHLGQHSSVERVRICGVRLTTEGVDGVKMFLTMHASEVKHVTISDVLAGDSTDVEQAALASLAEAFTMAQLQVLDLSRNTLAAEIWPAWQAHPLQRLVLDYVAIDDRSMLALDKALTAVAGESSLEELHMVLSRPFSLEGLAAANHFVGSSPVLKSLRWVYKHGTKKASFPLEGLRLIAERSAGLASVILEGARILDADLPTLVAALKPLKGLQVLKVRNVGFNDSAVTSIVEALVECAPPVVWLDLSYNGMTPAAALSLVQLADCPPITEHLERLFIDYNRIDLTAAEAVLEALGTKGRPDLEIRLESNPLDGGKLATTYLHAKRTAEQERDTVAKELDKTREELRKAQQRLRQITAGQTTIFSDFHALKVENQRLKNEQESLRKAFAILGQAQQIDETERVITRLSQLEDRVFGQRSPRSPASPVGPYVRKGIRPSSLERMVKVKGNLQTSVHSSDSDDSIDMALIARSPAHTPSKPQLRRSGSFDKDLPPPTSLFEAKMHRSAPSLNYEHWSPNSPPTSSTESSLFSSRLAASDYYLRRASSAGESSSSPTTVTHLLENKRPMPAKQRSSSRSISTLEDVLEELPIDGEDEDYEE